jgi:spermidine/putrescine transport system ATP-binding protein
LSNDVELDRIGKRFDANYAVRDVSFRVQAGEFFSILGPSGCGKTTLLRMIAGLADPTEGRILIGGQDMAGLPPNRRPTAMIFQSLALFPLMPVWENVAFGLEARGVAKATRRARALELLDLVALGGYGDRLPGELSGGQRQRVAIARALAVEPALLLLDEPLSALDLKLRQHMRAELRALQKRTGVTFIYITHDQSEALAMSDRVAVMSEGVLQQVADPRTLYANPETPFVARFVGETNTFSGQVEAVSDGLARLRTGHGLLTGRAGAGVRTGGAATIYIRPEALVAGIADANTLAAQVDRLDFEGAFSLVHGALADGMRLIAALPGGGTIPASGSAMSFHFAPEAALVLGDG